MARKKPPVSDGTPAEGIHRESSNLKVSECAKISGISDCAIFDAH